jgi:hypothetical protein
MYNNLTKISLSNISIIILIILPSIATVLILYDEQIFDIISKNFSETLYKNIFFLYTFTMYIIFFIMLGIYAPFPIIYSSEQYFKKYGYKNVITDYQRIKKILYISIPIFLSLLIIFSLRSDEWMRNFILLIQYTINVTDLQSDLFRLQIILFFIVSSAFLRLYIHIIKKDFRYYFAKACMIIAKEEDKEVDKGRFFMMGLQSYDLYLRRHLDLRIFTLDQIYDKVMTACKETKNNIINSISETFNNDKLEPLRYLSFLYKTKELQQILEKESIQLKLRQLGLFLAGAIPIIISLIQYIPQFIKDFF